MRSKRHPLAQAIRATLCAAAIAVPSVALLAAQSAHAAGSDYGDAPAPYRTVSADGGPSHAEDGPTLGLLRDVEADGAPSSAADGDDLTGSDDEDGIDFGTLQIGATDAGVVVNVQGEAGKLDAWIDLNADGAWTGPGEKVFDSVDVATGDNLLFFDLPAQGRAGSRFSRFRISRAGELGPDGTAADGEVEDHALALQAPSRSAATFYDSGQVLDVENGTTTVLLADLDGDGDLDLIEGNYGGSTPHKPNRVRLNDGNGNFTDSGQSLNSDDTFGLAVGDYDGDGDLDFAAANLGQRTKLYLNDGSGTFTLDQTQGANSAVDVAFADIDSDGDLDLIIGVLDDPNQVFINDGSGSFSNSGQALGDGRTLGITVGDVDADGDIDLIDALDNTERNRVYLNDGSGVFSDSGQLLTNNRTQDVDLGDVDGDGDLDLIESTSSGARLRLNDGSGDFSAGSTSLSSGDNQSSELVDVDGDGDLDLVQGLYNQGSRILFNDGGGNFRDSGQTLGNSLTYSIAVGDVDGDGDLDLIEGNYRQANTLWLNGDADFGDAPAPHRTLLAEDAARHALLGPSLGALRDGESDGVASASTDGDDLAGSDDEDGIDFGTLQIGATDAGVVVNVQGEVGKLDAWIDFNGDGSWTGPHEHVLHSVDVVIGDNPLLFDIPAGAHAITTQSRFRISREGSLGPDGFAASGEVEDHTLLLQPPGATLGGFVNSGHVLDFNNSTQSVLLADLDGDGDLDLFEGNYGASSALKINRVRLNDGSGNFVDSGQNLGADDTLGVTAGDYDGDGDIDLAAANLGQSTTLYLNDGSASFTLDQTLGSDSFAADAAFADIDSDGDLDLIIGVQDGPNEVFFNNGSGSFSDSGQALGDGFTLGITVGDVDRDGDIDFIEALDSHERNRVYLNDGSGVFTDSGQLLTNARTLDVDLGDVDGDGDLDLIESTNSGTRLRLNDGNGDFSAASTALSSSNTYSAELVDMDGDGDLDLIEGNYYQGARILFNDGNGSFSDSGQSLGSSLTYGIAVGDVDGDGDLDLIEGNYGSSNTLWLNSVNTVNLSVSSNSGSEAGLTQIIVTATATHAVSGDQTVDLSIDGVGITTGDYSLSSSQILIADGSSSGNVTFDVLNDTVFEGSETATLRISGTSLLLATGVISQDVEISDDETTPAIASLAFSPESFSENGGATVLTASISGTSTTDSCFDLSFAGGATLNVDYSSSDDDVDTGGTQVCVAAGDSSGSVTLTGTDDATFEGDEGVSVSSGSQTANATINDDELAPTITALSISPGNLAESGGVATLTATISHTSATAACFDLDFAGDATLAVDFSSDDDYAGTSGTQLCVAAGDTSGSIDLTGIDDATLEGDEGFSVSSGGHTANATVNDDDSNPSITGLSISPIAFSENGGVATLTATVSNASTAAACFDLSFAGTASLDVDYSSGDDDAGSSGTQLCVAAGDSSGSVDLTGIDDATFEGDEGFSVSSGGHTANATVSDDESNPAITALSISPTHFAENGGVATVTATLSHASTSASCFDLSFAGAASLGVDYGSDDDAGSSGTQLCVAAGDTSGTVDLTGIDDATFEGDENVSVSGGGHTAIATINDDDPNPAIAALSISPTTFAESGGVATLTATLSNASISTACFDLSFAGAATFAVDYSSDDDDAGSSGTQLCFAAGDTSGSVDLTGIDDATFEGDEGVTISSGGHTANATVNDDESNSAIAALSISPTSIAENGGVATLTATLSNASTSTACFGLSFAGVALFGTDYSSGDDDPGSSGTQVCVAAGDTSGSIDLTAIDDATFEGDEGVTVSSGGHSTNTTINDDDPNPTITALSISPTHFAENGGVATLTATLSNPSTSTECFDLGFAGAASFGTDYSSGDDDAASVGSQVCVAAGDLTGSLNLTGIDDAVFEGDEGVTLSSGGQMASATLVDDESIPVIASLSISPINFNENGGTAALTATMSHASTTDTCFDLGFSGTATPGVDFTIADDDLGSAGVQVCISAGDASRTTDLSGIDDALLEGDEAFSVHIQDLNASATVTDDERPDSIFQDGFEAP